MKPFLVFELKPGQATSKIHQSFELSSTVLFTDSLFYKAPGSGATAENKSSYMNGLVYHWSNTRFFNPYTITAQIQQKESLVKTQFTWVQKINFSKKAIGEIRVFAGEFLSGDLKSKTYYAFRGAGINGYQDKLFDYDFIARNERNGLGFSQFAEEDGALKVWTPWLNLPLGYHQ